MGSRSLLRQFHQPSTCWTTVIGPSVLAQGVQVRVYYDIKNKPAWWCLEWPSIPTSYAGRSQTHTRNSDDPQHETLLVLMRLGRLGVLPARIQPSKSPSGPRCSIRCRRTSCRHTSIRARLSSLPHRSTELSPTFRFCRMLDISDYAMKVPFEPTMVAR